MKIIWFSWRELRRDCVLWLEHLALDGAITLSGEDTLGYRRAEAVTMIGQRELVVIAKHMM